MLPLILFMYIFTISNGAHIFQKNYLWEKIIPTVANKDVYTYLRYTSKIYFDHTVITFC